MRLGQRQCCRGRGEARGNLASSLQGEVPAADRLRDARGRRQHLLDRKTLSVHRKALIILGDADVRLPGGPGATRVAASKEWQALGMEGDDDEEPEVEDLADDKAPAASAAASGLPSTSAAGATRGRSETREEPRELSDSSDVADPEGDYLLLAPQPKSE